MISIDKAKSIIYFTQPGRDGEVWIWWDDSSGEFIYTHKSQTSGKTSVRWLSEFIYSASAGVPLMDTDPEDPNWAEDRVKWVMANRGLSRSGGHQIVNLEESVKAENKKVSDIGGYTNVVGLYQVKGDYLIILYLDHAYGLEWQIINLKDYLAKAETLSGLEKL